MESDLKNKSGVASDPKPLLPIREAVMRKCNRPIQFIKRDSWSDGLKVTFPK